MVDSLSGIIIVVDVRALLFCVKKLREFAKNMSRVTGGFQNSKLEAKKDLDDLKKSVDATAKTVKYVLK